MYEAHERKKPFIVFDEWLFLNLEAEVGIEPASTALQAAA